MLAQKTVTGIHEIAGDPFDTVTDESADFLE